MRGGRYANRRREIEKGQLAHYIAAIVARLQPLQPAQIILFGSQATGEANAGSDIDLIVVLNGEAMPTTYQEKQALYLEVDRLLRDIRCAVPVDLVVLTRPMQPGLWSWRAPSRVRCSKRG